MAREGIDLAAAQRRNALFDSKGLLVTSRTGLADFQKPFAQDRAAVSTFVEAVEAVSSFRMKTNLKARTFQGIGDSRKQRSSAC